ncbi:HAD-like domain-containing protein [Papiliotrema laurentii]|uniref:HAD-like domain-containing protein n=1 Tax=Papiliotrema laurentii TaxID=5418 RepID=A0AAD9L8K3_PAPLA|nr:HAD-like domain-containing protein [Papiliotrema laurentii]
MSQAVLPYPPLSNAPFVVLSDWDGTITDKDSNDYLTDNLGMGYEQRRAMNHKVLDGSSNFRDSFRTMLESVHTPFEECKKVLQQNIGLDPGFKTFYKWCKENNVPVIIVSSGMEPIIRAVLETLLPAEDAQTIPIIANDVRYTDPEHTGKTWEIIYRHPESGFGHDKSKAILPYRDLAHKPTLFFCGDGVSDLSAAKHADVLFAKEMANGDSDLMQYCKREAIPFVPFRDFNKVLERVKEVVAGKDFKEVLKEEGN